MVDADPQSRHAEESYNGNAAAWWQGSAPSSGPLGARRGGIGVRLRQLIGVDESLLDRVPAERHRYTGLALVVIGTAGIAAFSMWNFIDEVFGTVTAAALLPALLWGLFIANLDSWLVSSLHGTRWRERAVGVVVPRMLLAVVFGFLIAEPLVLRAFHTAIETQVKESRKHLVDGYETHLKQCNPPPGATPLTVAGKCVNAQIAVTGVTAPSAVVTQLRGLHAQAARLQQRVNENNSELKRINFTARIECNGGKGRGFSGEYGEGVNCKSDRSEADKFANTARTSVMVQQIGSINAQIQKLGRNRAQQTQEYEKALAAAIAKKVAEMRASFGNIGLLERFKGLRQLVASNITLGVGEWLLRLVFVLIDCLPLIVKLFGGSTSYDRLVGSALVSAERQFDEELHTNERRTTSQFEFERYRLERNQLREKEDLDSDLRLKTARRDAEIDAAIDELTRRIMRQQDETSTGVKRNFLHNLADAG